ncbi:hypothetical protein [Streptomyces sp. NPDC015131]|uniref:hypothetical protein n=1 Tax=Streptomyces sp. NPDC015131 TaxID=3364941 RepID=UPI00370086B2
MRGEDNQPTRKGPKHAAPRKSLLTKLQAPAGKAMALAAMPTAVLVGLGMTPKLALADDKDIPFAPGPCVTRSDEPSESEKPAESPKPEPSQSATGTPGADEPSKQPEQPERDDKPDAGASPSASPSPSASASAPAGEPEKDTTDPKAGAPEQPAPEPTETETRNPLDPLGLGDKIKDIFDGPDDDEEQPSATPSASAPAPAKPPAKPAEPSEPAKPAEPDGKADEAGQDSGKDSGTATDNEATDTADAAKEAIKEAADKAGAEVEELPEDVKGLDPKKDEDIPEGAKPRFPCPTADPEALAAAELEPGIPLLPDDPWRLESTKLTLRGLDYHGIVEVKTGSGKIKKVLKFTASEVDIKDLHQLTVHSEGRTGHVTSRPGSESTITGGTVTMYTEELKGNLFGLIPITFSPDSPPPLNVPYAFFTNVKVTQAGQFGGNLTVPGLKNFIEG